MPARTALITGVTGQDGSYLAEWLLARGYAVHGVTRGLGPDKLRRLEGIRDRLSLHVTDLLDEAGLAKLIEEVRPDEVYHLAALSFVPSSWAEPGRTVETATQGSLRILEAVRQLCPGARVFQAASSEVFGQPQEHPQSESTPCHPRSPYGMAKLIGHLLAIHYRECHGLFVCSGILFNHESPRRGQEFVTRKVSMAAARIKLGLERELRLGNLQARRDWGHAADFVRAMWLMLQQDQADDFVLGTGQTHTVEELVDIAFSRVGLNWRDHVVVDPQFYRPLEPNLLVADYSKAQRCLGWQPEVTFEEMICQMVDHDLEQIRAPQRLAG